MDVNVKSLKGNSGKIKSWYKVRVRKYTGNKNTETAIALTARSAECFSLEENSFCRKSGMPRSNIIAKIFASENIVMSSPKESAEYSLAMTRNIRKKKNLSKIFM